MGRPERRHRDERAIGGQQAGDRVDPRHLERLLPRQRRENPGETPREHRLPGSRRPRQQEVVGSGSGDLERAPRPFLATDVGEVGDARRPERVGRKRVEGGSSDLSPEIRDRFGQMADGHRLDPCQCRLGSGLGGTDDAREPGPPRALRDRKSPGDGPNAPVERELSHRRVLGEPLRRNLARRGEHRKRDREVEPGPLLAQRGGCQVHGDPAVEGPFERSGHDAASNPVLGLLAGAVGEPDDREPGDTGLEMGLYLDAARLEADEGMSDRTREHPLDGTRGGVA